MINKILKSRDGLTIAELLVAMAVFGVAITIITGLFINTLQTQREINRIMTTNSDGAVIFEKLAREMRTGYNVSLFGGGCGSGSDSITFTRAKPTTTTTVTYSWSSSNKQVRRSEGSGSLVPLNSSEVNIDKLCFYETQNANNSDHPWRVTAIMFLSPTTSDTDYQARLQTTISPRVLPVETQ